MLGAADVSRAGRPLLFPDEVEIKAESQVTVLLQRKHQKIDTLVHICTMILTNYHLFFVSMSPATTSGGGSYAGQALGLSRIAAADDCASFFNPTSTRINLSLLQEATTYATASSDSFDIGLKFTDRKSSLVFLSLLRKALDKKSWTSMSIIPNPSPDPDPTNNNQVNVSPPSSGNQPSSSVFNVRSAGIAGLIRKQDEGIKSADSLAKGALSDLSSLMDRAREVVDMVQRFSAYLEQERSCNTAPSADSPGDDTVEMNEILQSIGVVAPTTRFSAGKLFHEQLLHEIADLLLTTRKTSRGLDYSGGRDVCVLEKLGGMVALTDLYCIVNRARGTELISPDDLIGACEMIRDGCSDTKCRQLGIRTHRFPSGVVVVQLNSIDEEEICRRTLSALQRRSSDESGFSRCIDVSSYASASAIPVVLAREHLLLAENHGVLCRDDCPEGLFFYKNVFT